MSDNSAQVPGVPSPEGLGELAEALGDGMGTRSKWAIKAAIEAARAEGIEGLLTIKIPARVRDFPEVGFVIGTVDVISRWAG